MMKLNEGLLWIKTTLKKSFQKAIETILILLFISLIYAFRGYLMGVLKMLFTYEVPIFWVIVVVILSLIVISIIRHTHTKQYNKLLEKTKPPRSIELFKAEAKCYFGTVRVLGDYLRFDIRVINRTNYRFLRNEVFLVCCRNTKSLFPEKWEEGMPVSHIVMSDLERLVGGSIQFDVPIGEIIQKIDNCRELMLSVKAKYTTEEDIIHDIPSKSVPVESEHLKYRLDEETIAKLKEWKKSHEAR